MNRIKTILFGAALVAASSALASAQPVNDRHEGRYEDRDHDRGRGRDNDRRFDRDRGRDDHRDFRDRDDRRYFHDRDDYRYRVGERRFFNGYYWNWDGNRWCRNERGAQIHFRF
ncbi:MAG: hypothetical protein LAP21_12920 [Acidobacteriia bacterium]|nr:hypothetical protein [Terriglobia bacterium]